MAWRIEISETAVKQLKKLGQPEAKRITVFLRERIQPLADPRQAGKALRGSEFGTFWRYRVGNYRLICDLQDDRLIILVVEIGHHSDDYR